MKNDSLEILHKTGLEKSRMDAFQNRVEADLNNAEVEIIILKYKAPEIEKKCLGLIIDHTDVPYKLTFYDNRQNHPNMAKIWNRLIKESTCDVVLVMDTDAFVTSNWIRPLVDCARRDECGIAYPVSGNSMTSPAHHKEFGSRLHDVSEHCTGYCFAMRKKVWEELGGFDEDFLVFGQDSDMCERVIHHPDYKLFIVPESLVYHGEQDREGIYRSSYSTRKASEEGEYDFDMETKFAPYLISHRSQQKYYERLWQK